MYTIRLCSSSDGRSGGGPTRTPSAVCPPAAPEAMDTAPERSSGRTLGVGSSSELVASKSGSIMR